MTDVFIDMFTLFLAVFIPVMAVGGGAIILMWLAKKLGLVKDSD